MAALVGTIGTAVQSTAGNSASPSWGASENRTAGNLLICFVSVTKSATLPTTPDGWYIASQVAGTSTSATIYYRNAAGGDAAPVIAGITSGLIAAQLAEFSATTSTVDRSATSTGTTSPNTATAGGTNAATAELIVMSSGDTRSVNRATVDTWTSNDGTVTLAGNNNSTSSQSHYSFGYIASSTATTAQTSVVTLSITTSITGIANVNASFRKGVGTFQRYAQAMAKIKAIGVEGFAQAQVTIAPIPQGFAQAATRIVSTAAPFTSSFLGGAQANTWGTDDNGGTWSSSSNSKLAVTGSSTGTVSAVGDGSKVIIRNPSFAINYGTPVEFGFSWSISSITGTDIVTVALGVNDSASISNDSYVFYTGPLIWSTNSAIGISVDHISDINTGIFSPQSYSAGVTYNVKAQVIPNSSFGQKFRLLVRTWTGGSEPTTWNSTDTAFNTPTGSTGNPVFLVSKDAGATSTVTISNIYIRTIMPWGSGQAQAKIKATTNSFAQAQVSIASAGPSNAFAQAQGFVRPTDAYGLAVYADGPIAWYRLGEPSGEIIDSMPGLNGTASGVTRDAASLIPGGDGSVQFTGFSQTIDVPDQNKLDLGNGPFSIELLTKITTGALLHTLVSKEGGGAYQISIDTTSGNKILLVQGGTAIIYTSDNAISLDTTYHIVWTRNGSGAANNKLYVNGVLWTYGIGDDAQTFINTSGQLHLGYEGSDGEYTIGYLDEVAIYNSILSGARVLAHYAAAIPASNAFAQAQAKIKAIGVKSFAQAQTDIKQTYPRSYAKTVVDDGPIAYWRAGDLSGTTAVDVLGTNNGTYSGTYSLGTTGLITGDSDKSVNFTAGQITVPNTGTFNLGDGPFTIEFWMRVTGGLGTFRKIIVNGIGDGFEVALRSDDTIKAGVPAIGYWGSTTTTFTDSNKHHIVVMKEGSTTRKIYVDGVDVTTDLAVVTSTNSSTLNTVIGSVAGDEYFVGDLDEIAIYNKLLTTGQITEHYTVGTSGVRSATFAQAQAKIKAIDVEGFAQAQTDVKQVYKVFSQAQAQVKQTYNAFAQSQADIKATSNKFAQAQADIKQTYNAFAQARTWIKTTTNQFSQAQADIKATSQKYSQAQADIKQTYRGFAQAQTDIKQTYNRFAQAQAWVEQAYTVSANAQAKIKAIGVEGFAQVQARVGSGGPMIWVQDTYNRTLTNSIGQPNIGHYDVTDITGTGNIFVTDAYLIANSFDGQNITAYVQSDHIETPYLDISLDFWFQDVQFARNYDILLISNALLNGSSETLAELYFNLGDGGPVYLISRNFTIPITPPVSNDTYRIKLRQNGTSQYYVKLWNLNDPEPDWMISDTRDTVYGNTVSYQVYAKSIAGELFAINLDTYLVTEILNVHHAQAQASIKATSRGYAQAGARINAGGPLIYIKDTFTRTEANPGHHGLFTLPPDIGSYDLAEAFLGLGASASIDGSTLVLEKHASVVLAALPASYDKLDISVDFKLTGNLTTGGSVDLAIYVATRDYTDGSNLAQYIYYFDDHQVFVGAVDNYLELAETDTTANVWYTLKTRLTNGTLYTKTWKRDSEVEPEWQVSSALSGLTGSYLTLEPIFDTTNSTQLLIDNYQVTEVLDVRYAQAQALIVANIVTRNAFAQAQTDVKQTYRGFAQAQTWIENTYNGFAQSQADIKQTYNAFAQAQAQIKTTYQKYAQAQADIEQTYNQFAQAQTDIKQTYRGYAQAQAKIATTRAYAQAQADVKQTYFGFAQAQAKIATTRVYAQAQGWIEVTANRFSQAQADIKQTYNAFAQSQAWIEQTYNRSAQGQAWIEQTYNQFGQAQAQITQTYQVFAQAQTWIEQTGNQFAQSQAQIKQTYNAFAQANADIKQTYNAFAQAQVWIEVAANQSAQAQAWIEVTTNQFAQSQADIKQTYNQFGQAQTDIKQTYNQFAQASTWIEQTYSGYAQAQAKIATTRVYAQAQASTKTIYNVCGQAQCYIKGQTIVSAQAQVDVKQTYSVNAQSQADIKQVYKQFSQAQTWIEVTNNRSAQAQAWIETTPNQVAQAQAQIKQTYNAFAQAQTSIKQTYNAFAQAGAWIENTYNGFGQAQADIKQTYRAFAQAGAWIETTNNVSAQAQAWIENTYTASAQAQAWIKTTYNAFGQAQAKINAFGVQRYAQAQTNVRASGTQWFAQAQAKINAFGVNGFGQAQADIKATSKVFAQAQADILVTTNKFAQAQTWIEQTYNKSAQAQTQIKTASQAFAQAQAAIKTTSQGCAQGQADIKQTYKGFAQAQAKITSTYQQYAQAQAKILGTSGQYAQSQAQVKNTYRAHSQAQTAIRAVSVASGQAQAYLQLAGLAGYAQAQATIRTSSTTSAQANASIRTTYAQYANAQAAIKVQVINVAQAAAIIRTTNPVFAQAQATITAGSIGFAQAQAYILLSGLTTYAQAQAVIIKAAGYSQAQAFILQPIYLHTLKVGDRIAFFVTIGDTAPTPPKPHDRAIQATAGDRLALSLTAGDREQTTITSGDRNFD